MERSATNGSSSRAAGHGWPRIADGAGGYEFESARELFSDVTIDRDAFTSAAITWGAGQ